jgi:glutamate 5-kinase
VTPSSLSEQRDALMTSSRTSASVGQVTLIDLLDRLLQGGIVIHGQIMLSVADIDLVELDLRVLVAGIETVAGG